MPDAANSKLVGAIEVRRDGVLQCLGSTAAELGKVPLESSVANKGRSASLNYYEHD